MKYTPTSIKEIISEIKDHPLLASLSEETIVTYTKKFIGRMALPELYNDKVAVLEINNYRAALPEDFVKIIGVRSYPKNDAELNSKSYKPVYYRAATDLFYHSDKHYHLTTPTYKIENTVIYTSLKKGKIEIAYKSICTDDCGYPMIPDNEKFKIALEDYIKFERFTVLFDMEQISLQSLQMAQQQALWSQGACATEFKLPSYDEAESMIRQQGQMLIRNRHKTGFADSGENEYRWIK